MKQKYLQAPKDLQNCLHSLCKKCIFHSSLPHCGYIVPSSTLIFNGGFEGIFITTLSGNFLLYGYCYFNWEFDTSLCPKLTNEDISDSSLGNALKPHYNSPAESKTSVF